MQNKIIFGKQNHVRCKPYRRTGISKALLLILVFALPLLLSACSGIKLENKTEQVEGYTKEQAMILLANERNRYQNAYTASVWDVEVGEKHTSFDRLLVQNVKGFMEQMRLICMLAEEEGVTVTSQERDELRQLSETWLSGLSEADLAYIGCTKEDVQRVYTDYFQANKLVRQLTAKNKSEISDSQAKVIHVQQIVTSSLPKAKALLKQVKIDKADFGSTAGRYSESEVTERELKRGSSQSLYERTAFALDEGEISNIISADGLYYIIKCVNGYDEEATRERKDRLQKAINNQTFQAVFAPYREEHNIRFAERFWNHINLKEGTDSSVENFFDLYEQAFPETEE